jgi:hypothetical protein
MGLHVMVNDILKNWSPLFRYWLLECSQCRRDGELAHRKPLVSAAQSKALEHLASPFGSTREQIRGRPMNVSSASTVPPTPAIGARLPGSHSFTKTMAHEPSSLQRDAKRPV